MKAVRIHKYGGIDTLIYEEAPMPEIGPDEVLIKIAAAGINPIDYKIREGHMKEGYKITFPLILGWDVSGTVEQKGELVTRFSMGDKVISRSDISRNGAYCEYISVRASELAFAPASIPLNFAAGIPLAAQTAWTGLFELGILRSGQSVLIHGASGGVGIFAVQFAKLVNAHVIATSSTKNVDFLKSIGADVVIDYSNSDFETLVKNVDLVFDTIGGITQKKSWNVIKKGGMLVSTVGADQTAAEEHQVNSRSFMLNPNGARLQEISGLVDEGKIRVFIEKEFPLKDVGEAHKLIQGGHVRGKLILNV
jgi:NADPH:quinone reductase-like Zn-dependent oxidoreductase